MDELKQVTHIIIHHSNSGYHSIRSIKRMHVNKNKWEDIGYHFLIGNGLLTRDGKLYYGRDENLVGAHIKGRNHYSLGVCLIGNMDKHPLTKKQMKKLISFLVELCETYGVEPENIRGHNEFSEVTKTCPGKFTDMDKIREEVKALLV